MIFVLNAQHELVLLKRAPGMKTCPGTWSVVGEHAAPNEEFAETAFRGLREELFLNETEVKLYPVWTGPLHLRIHYDNQRLDNQWTMFYYTILPARKVISFCEEASGVMLLPLADFATQAHLLGCHNMQRFLVADSATPSKFRNTTYPDLLRDGAAIVSRKLNEVFSSDET
eukprot:CAMPEP_0198197650 /NCGR_PEP_ID=MMETSP1445-20131203/1215_1 /TAXON_ID=36898 /ORGANISM="Pyramimonas sp., Strain CCMP2087" /LENGTH=170 /DNA_ID=CAMNT_0043866985 /DNA_START=358 /DNA_END=870 /DNA_ORIENTATION=+